MKQLLTFLLIAFTASLSFGQEADSTHVDSTYSNVFIIDSMYENGLEFGGNIEIVQDEAVASFTDKFIRINRKRGGFHGYRVKIYAQNHPSARAQARAIKTKIDEKNAKIEDKNIKRQKVYVKYIEPNFEVHVGDFIRRFDAVAYLNEIKGDYHEAYMIKTIITFPRDMFY